VTKAPPITPELLKYLDENFPDRCPDPAWSDREIWLRAGERRLVRHLQRIGKEQAENVYVRSKNSGPGNAPAPG
jgi:hypothetical protein